MEDSEKDGDDNYTSSVEEIEAQECKLSYRFGNNSNRRPSQGSSSLESYES